MRKLLPMLLLCACATAQRERMNVRFVTDEADAVLAILDKRAANGPITDADWQRVFASEGYIRLKAREHSMQRAFEDDTFRAFVMSDELLARRAVLAKTLRDWTRAKPSDAAKRAFAYLPAGATIRAKVYPAIKPAKNSFVFDVANDPAIFVYIEDVPRAVFETTIAHELHHIGYGTTCHIDDDSAPQGVRDAYKWISAFGEGVATLAAAGGPNGDPQPRPEVKAEWVRQMARRDENFRNLEQFLLATARGELTGDAQTKRAMEFFGFVGPWYTVGWTMGVTIEQTLGRQALIDAMCDQRTLLATYNRAALEWKRRTGETLPLWCDELLDSISQFR